MEISMSELTGRIAIVTGASGALGESMARGLAEAGAKVVATGHRNIEKVERLASALAAAGATGSILPFKADVKDDRDCLATVEFARERFGRLDILINNAALGMTEINENYLTQPTHFWKVTPEIWRAIIDTNVTGPFLMARHAVPIMLAAQWGRIINISVSARYMQRPGSTPDACAKAALEVEAAIWAKDLKGTGVTANTLSPGGTVLSGHVPESYVRETGSSTLDPDIMITPLLWLASEKSDHVTGMRIIASRWRNDIPESIAANVASETAGWRG
jgi:3-oxoacyl-[acyl-carrier protein] reductase